MPRDKIYLISLSPMLNYLLIKYLEHALQVCNHKVWLALALANAALHIVERLESVSDQ